MSAQSFLIYGIASLTLAAVLLPLFVEIKECLRELRKLKELNKTTPTKEEGE